MYMQYNVLCRQPVSACVCAHARVCVGVCVCVRSHATTDNDASYISAVGYLLVATVCLGECSVCVKFVQCWVSVKFV